MVKNNNFKIPFWKDWEWSLLVTRFSNSVPLKSQRSHLDTLCCLVGYIITENTKVIGHTREITNSLPAINKKSRFTLINV